tara:strand:+ start:476 stop:697 length:222 start_codon:yes stop_codon:yes gene_type:complete
MWKYQTAPTKRRIMKVIMIKPRVLPIAGKINKTKKPTKNVHSSKYKRYACGASSGSWDAPKVSKPSQFIMALK